MNDTMTLVLDDPEAIAEIHELMRRFNLSAKDVVEKVIIDAGRWMPMETLAYPLPLASKRQLQALQDEARARAVSETER